MFVRNAATTIERALLSVLDQKIPDLELLVLDGGSTDRTMEIVLKYRQNITYCRSAPDGGPTNAINEGIERASGDIICLLPGDDWFEPEALENVMERFSADPDLDVLSCGTRYVWFDDSGNMRVDQQFLSPQDLEFSMEKILAYPLTAGRIMRRRVYQRLGGHNADFRFADYDFLVRACLSGIKSSVLPTLTFTYRRHPQSTTFGNNPENLVSMLREGIRMTAIHAARKDISDSHRKALLDRNCRAAAHYSWHLLRNGRFGELGSVIAEAIHTNPWWPVKAAFLLFFGSKSRGSGPMGN